MIGTCSKTCGTGTRTNTRIKLVEEANGGTCSGQPTEIEECNTQPCPGIYVNMITIRVRLNKVKIVISYKCVVLFYEKSLIFMIKHGIRPMRTFSQVQSNKHKML